MCDQTDHGHASANMTRESSLDLQIVQSVPATSQAQIYSYADGEPRRAVEVAALSSCATPSRSAPGYAARRLVSR
jgi:hypothetical protein